MKRISAIFLFLFISSSTSYASLIGNEMTANWTYAPFNTTDLRTFTVGQGVEVNGWASEFIVDVQSSKIIVDNVTGPGSGLANGVTWTFTVIDWGGTLGSITGASVNTNYTGWSGSFLTFDPNSVTISFGGDVDYGSYTTDIFEINVSSATSAVPIPSAVWLFFSGLLGLLTMSKMNSKTDV